MAQVIPQYNIGDEIGKGMSTGLSNSLGTLARFKMDNLLREQESSLIKEAQKTGDVSKAPKWYQEIYYRTNPYKMMNQDLYGEQQPTSGQAIDPMQQGQGQNPQGQGLGVDMMQQLQQQGSMQQEPWHAPMMPQQQQQMQQQMPMQGQPTSGQQMPNRMRDDIKEAKSLGYNIYNPKSMEAYKQYKLKAQSNIDSKYKTYHTNLQKDYAIDLKKYNTAKEALDIIRGGGTREGIMGNLPTEYSFAGDETRELDRKYKQLIAEEASKLTGVLTGAKIKLTEGGKVSLNQSKATQVKILKEIAREAEEGGMAINQISNEIKEANGGDIPKGFDTLVEKEYKRRYPEKFESNEPIPSGRGKVPSEDVVDKLLKKAGNDPDKARELAKKMGYSV